MPLEPFAVFQITDSMIVQDEPMGSKEKFWCQLPPELGDGRWLFKEPRQQEENIEHLAEKIAHEVASLIQLPCARVELAEFKGVRGSISLDVRSAGDVLVHGNEIIAGRGTWATICISDATRATTRSSESGAQFWRSAAVVARKSWGNLPATWFSTH